MCKVIKAIVSTKYLKFYAWMVSKYPEYRGKKLQYEKLLELETEYRISNAK
jgi:hypothetical protein